MYVLVTGANGFIGSNLVKALIDKGNNVKAMVLKGTNEAFIKDLACEIVYADITKKETLKESLTGVDTVYHLAALPSSAWTDRIFQVNYEGTKNIFYESISAKVKRFVYMSSLVVHGFKRFDGTDETTPLHRQKKHQRPYIKSKIACENFLRENMDKIELVIVRPGFTIFGKNDLLASKELIGRLDSGKNVPNVNEGKAKMGYVYVENLADGLILAGTVRQAAGQTYVIADYEPQYISMKIFTDALCTELGRKPNKGSIPYGVAAPFVALLDSFYRIFLRNKLPKICMYTLKVAKTDLYFKSDKAKKELGYVSNVKFEDAIKKTISWYRSYFKKK